MRPWLAACALGLLGACGGGGSGPDPVPGGPAAVTLTFLSAENGAPVANATVRVGSAAPVTTSASGQISAPVSSGTFLQIDAADFLVRSTLYRGDPRVTLWPVRPGADATFVNELVYNSLIANGALTRPVTNVTFVPSQALLGDARIRAVHEEAAAKLSAVLGGTITYSVAESAEPGTVVFDVKVDPNDSFFANSGIQAVTRISQLRNRILSGSITFRSLHDAGVASLVTHEMGHAYGLGHPSQPGLMSPNTIGNFSDYTGAEKLEMRVMLQRLPGTLPPDDDRDASTSSNARRSAAIGCGAGDAP